ncbi:hypothetical protein ACOKM5_21495 [Streptomyces sp. BH097]
MTHEPVLVAEVHQGTGPGFNVYACPPCAEWTQPHEADRSEGAAQ